jgi:biopolymer transport protein ExbB
MNILEILAKGGFMMIPIILSSIIAIAILVERLISLRKIAINARTFVLQVKNLVLREQVNDAILLCKQTPGPISAITKAGLVKRNRSREEIKDSIENAARTQIFHLERNLGVLGTIAAIAPLMGFLGTVTGMIQAFMEIQARGGNVDSSVLAGGIWEALITTAAGLSVGIPALIFYNWIQAKVEAHVHDMQESSTELLDMLLEKETAHDDRTLA